MDQSNQTPARISTVCLLILTGLALAAAMAEFSRVLIPFVLALLLTYSLAPIIDAQRRWLRLPRSVAIFNTIILGCAMLVLVGLFINSLVRQISGSTERYRAQINQLLIRITDWLPEGIVPEGDSLTSLLKLPGASVTGLVSGAMSGVMNVVSNGILVLIFMIFLIAGRRADPPPGSVLHDIERQTKRYVSTMVLTSGLTGVLVGLTLWLLGVEFAIMFGFLAFLLNFIPNIGSVIATLLPVPVAILSPELGTAAKVAAIAIPGGIQFLIGNLVQPKVMGQSLDLHPVVVLIALIFFGIIWGIVGMFLATPITAVLRILLDKLDYTRPMANLMSGKLVPMGSPSAA